MEAVYEFEGVLYHTPGEYLDAVAHAYKHGDEDLAVTSLEDYGFSLSDLNVAGHQPHPRSATLQDSDEEVTEEE